MVTSFDGRLLAHLLECYFYLYLIAYSCLVWISRDPNTSNSSFNPSQCIAQKPVDGFSRQTNRFAVGTTDKFVHTSAQCWCSDCQFDWATRSCWTGRATTPRARCGDQSDGLVSTISHHCSVGTDQFGFCHGWLCALALSDRIGSITSASKTDHGFQIRCRTKTTVDSSFRLVRTASFSSFV